ncbi:hypothetical protein FK178_15025 [Antarcticibacterium arcticum]|uniref:Lipoprotein SmpA/OmlA domain-containing protein n=1 Tax=Antarcticibacterium arcticum TaxID=2585771 RepID=A0A5B8YRY0_9FLAO|nr:hypothetical protein [Antarcticibacterium arcticum]QED38949.1 hypothetical protein FK178_15025 [Antarcticibacterium arcticum]
MKKIFYTNFFLFILLISCSKANQENFEDLKKIETGMEVKKVLSIMRNDPINVKRAPWNDSLFIYYFSSPAAASDHYKIIFKEEDSTVIEINFGD